MLLSINHKFLLIRETQLHIMVVPKASLHIMGSPNAEASCVSLQFDSSPLVTGP